MTVIAMTKTRLFTTAVMLLAAGCAGAINGDGDIGDDLVDDPPEREEVATIDAPDDGLGGDAFIPRESPPDVDTLAACLRTVDVAGSAALAKALAGAQPGDCLLLADGTYTFPTIDKKGTEASPIFVRAAHTLKVVVASGSLMLKGAAFVEVQGIDFKSAGTISLNDCDRCRISRFRMERKEQGKGEDWIRVNGTSHDCRIDHNDFGPQTKMGNMIMLAGAGPQVVQRTRVDHNFIHDVKYGGGNGWETIRAGLSGWTFSRGFTVIENNLFLRADNDPETISIKSSDNTIRFNTLRATDGHFTLRHGNRTSVYGNYIFGDGVDGSAGIRVFGGDHRIFNNYIEGVSRFAISLESGESNDKGGALTDHKQVYRAQVVFNTVVDSRINLGGGKKFQPTDCTVADNIMQGAGTVLSEHAGTSRTTFAANIVNGKSGVSTGVQHVDPKLVRKDGVFRPAADSPAIDSGTTSFPFVTSDIDGNARSKPDIGADEVLPGAATRGPLTEADVGPFAP